MRNTVCYSKNVCVRIFKLDVTVTCTNCMELQTTYNNCLQQPTIVTKEGLKQTGDNFQHDKWNLTQFKKKILIKWKIIPVNRDSNYNLSKAIIWPISRTPFFKHFFINFPTAIYISQATLWGAVNIYWKYILFIQGFNPYKDKTDI